MYHLFFGRSGKTRAARGAVLHVIPGHEPDQTVNQNRKGKQYEYANNNPFYYVTSYFLFPTFNKNGNV